MVMRSPEANDTAPDVENVNAPAVEIVTVPTDEPFFFTVYTADAVGFVPTVPTDPEKLERKLTARAKVRPSTNPDATGFPARKLVTS